MKYNSFLGILLICMPLFFACQDPVLNEEYGKALIYMPQATKNIGTSSNYDISLINSNSPDTLITLGIYRSGLQQLESVTVDLVINLDTVARAQSIAQEPFAPEKYDIYKTGVLLPENYYAPLPDNLTIPNGSRETTFELTLKKELILNNYNSDDILLLPIQIKNPTKYEINKSLDLTMIVIKLK